MYAASVVFNGPRAMFNFNDGMIGGDNVHGNLLANAVRESGDHSAINSWVKDPRSPMSRAILVRFLDS